MSVPALRFSEFTDDWTENTIQHFIDNQSILGHLDGNHGALYPKSEEFSKSGVPYIAANNLVNGKVDFSSCKFLPIAKAKLFKKGVAKDGDVLFAHNATVGPCAILKTELDYVVLSTTATYFRCDLNKINNGYLYNLFQSDYFVSQYTSIMSQSTRNQVPITTQRTLYIALPSLPEQTKIANFLTAVDEKIQLLTQKHDLLTQYKKGVMQQIFSQELRFKDDDGRDFPEWEEKQLGDVAEITTGSSNRVDSTVGDGAYTFFDRSQDIRTSDIYLFDCEAVIVAGEGQEFIPKHFVGKFDLHQRTYAIKNFNNFEGKYLFYYVYQHRNYFLSQAVGSTVKSLRLPMFQKMPISQPCIKEQTKIANFLTAIDDKITATHTQLQAVKHYKQGLLQQMFV